MPITFMKEKKDALNTQRKTTSGYRKLKPFLLTTDSHKRKGILPYLERQMRCVVLMEVMAFSLGKPLLFYDLKSKVLTYV